ncbi:MAG TPA: aldo/keto reductase, partial [Actinomycetales bacterium]
RLRDYTADGVRRSLEASMRRLQVDRVDIVLVHDPDDHLDQAAAEALPALARLRDEGVVGAVGVGMNQWQGPLRLLETGLLDVVMLASRWTLLDRTGEALLDAGERHGASVVAAAPYASGLLATPRPVPGATYEYQQAPPGLVERAAAMADRCEAAGLTMPDAALQFALRRDVVSAVLAGLRDADEVAAALARLSTDVPEEVWHDLGA